MRVGQLFFCSGLTNLKILIEAGELSTRDSISCGNLMNLSMNPLNACCVIVIVSGIGNGVDRSFIHLFDVPIIVDCD